MRRSFHAQGEQQISCKRLLCVTFPVHNDEGGSWITRKLEGNNDVLGFLWRAELFGGHLLHAFCNV